MLEKLENTGYDWLKKKNFNIFFIVFLHHATFSFKKEKEKLFQKSEKREHQVIVGK